MIENEVLERFVLEYRETQDKKVLEKIILACYPMMEHLAEKRALRYTNIVEISDLIGYGIIGLLKSIEQFEPAKGAGFGTYAYIRIQGAMQDGLRSIDWISSGARKKARFLDNLYAQIVQRFLRNPSHEEMAQALNMTMKEFGKILQEHSRMKICSIESILKNFDLVDIEADPVNSLIDKETVKSIRYAVDQLTIKEKTVIEMHYYQSLTLTEIAKRMGFSLSYISRLHKRAIDRLKKNMDFIEVVLEEESLRISRSSKII